MMNKSFVFGVIFGFLGLIPWVTPKSVGSLYDSAKSVGSSAYTASYNSLKKIMVPQAVAATNTELEATKVAVKPTAKVAPIIREEVVIVRKIIIEETRKADGKTTIVKKPEIVPQPKMEITAPKPFKKVRAAQLVENTRIVPKTTFSIVAE